MATENLDEVFKRIGRLEQDVHTLNYRANELAEHNLPIRVANLEPVVKSIGADVAKIEASTDRLTSVVTSMRSWGVGFAAALSFVVVLISVIPMLKGVI
jgi:uncharacterized protein YoxC